MASASVRIPTKVLIEKLEARLTALDAEYEKYVAEKEKYDKAVADLAARATLAIHEKAAKMIQSGDFEAISISQWRGTQATLSVNLGEEHPTLPRFEQSTVRKGSKNVPEREVIKETLAVLRLTDQETVGASFYNSFTGIL